MSFYLTALTSHQHIGWDFDETLIDSPASPILWQFILDHPEIEHTIVTFRTHGLVDAIWNNLARHTDRIGPENFDRIVSIDDRMWMEHHKDELRRLSGSLSGPLTAAETAYREWKGMACQQHGLTALVDDKTDHVMAGCEKHGIILFDPLNFVS